MKKLAIVIFLVVAGCRRQVNVTTSTTPTTPPASPEILSSGSGAVSPREAVQKFMAAAKAQDLQAMADIWGSQSGPARTSMGKDQLEPRLIYMMRCLRHDTYSILSEAQVADGERAYIVEVRRGTLAPKASFTSTPGPQNRWYMRTLQLEALNSICTAK